MLVLLPLRGQEASEILIVESFDTNESNPAQFVLIDGEKVFLGGISLRSLNKVVKNHDFSGLAFQVRSNVYQGSKLPITWPVFKNVLAGFGEGSELQGDLGGKIFGVVADWTSSSLLGVGLGGLLIDLFFVYPFYQLQGDKGFFETDDALRELSVGALLIGAGTFVIGRIIQAVLPVSYGSRYNTTLRNGLGLNKDMEDVFNR